MMSLMQTQLLRRIAKLWRGDWSGSNFDGRDLARWLDIVLNDVFDDMQALGDELAGFEDASGRAETGLS